MKPDSAKTPETTDPLLLGESEEERITSLCTIFGKNGIDTLRDLVELTPYKPLENLYTAVLDRLEGGKEKQE